MIETIFGSPWGPLVIFGLRIIDVSLATTRMLLIWRGQRLIAPAIGFFEVMIWLLAAGTAIRFLSSPLHVVAYAGGYATGSFVGIWVEGKLALGLATVRVISRHGGVELADALRNLGFGVTEFSAHGREGPVEVLFTAVRRQQVRRVLKEVDVWDPNAFVTVEEPRSIHRGWMVQQRR